MSEPVSLEHLVAAIRDPGTTMEDLTRMVGPSPEQSERQNARVRALDSLWERADRLDNRWGCDPDHWPSPARERYKALTAECSDFENRHC